MNKFISFSLAISLFTTNLLWAEETASPSNITTETNNNNILRNNALNNSSGSRSGIVSGGMIGKDSQLNITDDEKKLSENFVHQGKANRVYEDQCKSEDMRAICQGSDPSGGRAVLIQAVSKAYALFGSLGGDGFLSLKNKNAVTKNADIEKSNKEIDEVKKKGETPTGEKQEKVDEKQTDYCKYIPTATELISQFMQQSAGVALTASSGGDTAQKDALLKAAKNHDERAKGAQIQAAGWWASAACYGVMMTTVAVPDKNAWIKLAASTFLGGAYQSEVSANKEYAEKTRKVAELLPGKGDCNPVTDKLCYCSQPETENDPTYCFKQIHQKQIAKTSARISCIDNQMKADPTCGCEKNNTCFEKLLLDNDVNNQLGFAYGNNPMFNSVKTLAHGELVGGTLNGASFAQTQAIAKKTLNDLVGKIPASNPSGSDLKLAKAYQDGGLPPSAAALLASTSVDKGQLNSAMAKMSGLSGLNNAPIASIGGKGLNHLIDFSTSGGNNLGKGKTNSQNSAIDFSKLSNIGKKDGNNSNKLIEFAVEKSQRANQINRKDQSIFEIISNRYAGTVNRLTDIEPKN